MLNKKGVSEVITTVLIILLALAAVLIVGQIVLPLIRNMGGQVTSGTDCFSLSITPIKCTSNATGNPDASVQFRNDKGVVTKVKLIKEDSTGATTTADSSVGAFGTNTSNQFSIVSTDKFKVAAIVTSSSGEDSACGISDPITCE